jgi:hypothetical protein
MFLKLFMSETLTFPNLNEDINNSEALLAEAKKDENIKNFGKTEDSLLALNILRSKAYYDTETEIKTGKKTVNILDLETKFKESEHYLNSVSADDFI